MVVAIGMHRSASKDDIIRLKVQHLERTCQICREFSEQVSCKKFFVLFKQQTIVNSSERETRRKYHISH